MGHHRRPRHGSFVVEFLVLIRDVQPVASHRGRRRCVFLRLCRIVYRVAVAECVVFCCSVAFRQPLAEPGCESLAIGESLTERECIAERCAIHEPLTARVAEERHHRRIVYGGSERLYR